MIAIIIPTIEGREDSLERTIASYADVKDSRIVVWDESPSAGAGWNLGLEVFVEWHGEPDFVHFTNDDCELIGGLQGAMGVCQTGRLPCPIVRNPGGSLQSAGGDMGAPDNLLKTLGPDLSPVGFTTVPFMSWSQWEQIGMLDLHYSSDVWVSYRGRQFGIETVLCHGYEITHHNHSVGRGAGMSQGQRAGVDRQAMERALANAA